MIVYNNKQLEAGKLIANPNKTRIMLEGGANSGKTFVNARAVIIRAVKYNGSKHIVNRKTLADCVGTVWLEIYLPMLEILQREGLCKIYKTPAMAEFINGSIIKTGGLALHEKDKVLAIKWATIHNTEASEISYQIIEPLYSRLHDTSTDVNGKVIIPKMLNDQNPPTVNHWTYKEYHLGVNPIDNNPRKDLDKYAKLHFVPKDNIENIPQAYIDDLENLSKRQRDRFLLGLYGQIEGLVYEDFDPEIHIVDDFEVPEDWPKIRSHDFGFVDPTACLWSAYDKSNETLYYYREYKEKGLTGSRNCKNIVELSKGENYDTDIADHQSEYRNTYAENGIQTIAANKQIYAGIERGCFLFQKKKSNYLGHFQKLLTNYTAWNIMTAQKGTKNQNQKQATII